MVVMGYSMVLSRVAAALTGGYRGSSGLSVICALVVNEFDAVIQNSVVSERFLLILGRQIACRDYHRSIELDFPELWTLLLSALSWKDGSRHPLRCGLIGSCEHYNRLPLRLQKTLQKTLQKQILFPSISPVKAVPDFNFLQLV